MNERRRAHALDPAAIAAMFGGERLAIAREWEERFERGLLTTRLDTRAARRAGLFDDEDSSSSSSESDDFERDGALGVVTISGPLLQTGGGWWFDGHAAIRGRIESAAASGIKMLALRIDSPGGVVAGNMDGVRASIAAVAAAGIKCQAWCGGNGAFSAAYAWACVAASISVPDTGGVGSVGTMCVMTDCTKANEMEGVRRVVVRSGTRKAEGHPDLPKTPDVIAREQAIVDGMAGIFAGVVSAARMSSAGATGKALTTDAVLALQGEAFYGVRAVEVGLADRVESWDSFLARCRAMAEEESMKGLKGYLGLAEDASDERVMQVLREREASAAEKVRVAEASAAASKTATDKLAGDGDKLAGEFLEFVCAEALVAGRKTAAEIAADKALLAGVSPAQAARGLRERYAAIPRGAGVPQETKAPVDAPRAAGPATEAARAAVDPSKLDGGKMSMTAIGEHYADGAVFERLLAEYNRAHAAEDASSRPRVNIPGARGTAAF